MTGLIRYRIVATVIGIVLIAAGVLKLLDVRSRIPYRPETLTPAEAAIVRLEGDRRITVDERLTASLLAGAEIVFGAWILLGLWPRATRWVAIVVVLALLNVAAARAFAGEPSCGCFGKASPSPWFAVGFDVLAFVSLLLVRNQLVLPKGLWVRSAAFVVVAAGVAGTVVGLNRSKVDGGLVTITAPDVRGEERGLLDEVIAGIEANSAAFKSLRVTAEETRRDLTVKEPTRSTVRLPGGGISSSASYPLYKTTRRYTVTAAAVRCDFTPTVPAEHVSWASVETATAERHLQYIVPDKQVWLRRPETAAVKDNNWIDVSTWGFVGDTSPPLNQPKLWFGSLSIRSVARGESGGQPGILVEAETGPRTRLKCRVAAFFLQDRNFLPGWMEVRRPDDWLVHRVEYVYQQIPGRGAWIPKTATNRLWGDQKAKAADDPGLIQHKLVEAGAPEMIDAPVPPEVFDPPLPAGVMVRDWVQTGRMALLKKPAAAVSEVPAQLPVPPAPEPRSRPSPLIPLALLNACAVGGLLVFRRRVLS